MQLYMSWHIRSFFGFTFLNILYFFKYSCSNIFHRRSLYTFYWKSDPIMIALKFNLFLVKSIGIRCPVYLAWWGQPQATSSLQSLNHYKLVTICIRVNVLRYFFSKWKLGSNTWQVLWFIIAYTLRRWLSANKHQAHVEKIWVKWLLDNWIKSLKTIVICSLLWQHHTVPITSAIVRGKRLLLHFKEAGHEQTINVIHLITENTRSS